MEFGERRVVDELSLRVGEREVVGFLGPNGAGKSTTISCISGLLQPRAGTVTVCGASVSGQSEAVRRHLGVVPQQLAIFGQLNAVTNLRIFAGMYGLTGKKLADRVAWGLDLAQLTDRADSRVDTLSGGMKRRLNLACSLLHEPQVLICDEPTTGVDPQSRNHIFEMLKALRDDGLTIVYTTHYMEEVEALCERVAIIDTGRIVADDQIATLTADGKNLEQVFLELTGRGLRD